MKSEASTQPICPLCLTKESKLAFVKFQYANFHCHFCHSLYVYPTPESTELEEFYKSPEGEQLSTVCWTESADSHNHVWEVWQEALKYIEKMSGRGRLLDIGCGTGQFLEFARTQGWTDLTGIELVPEVANKARQISGAVIYTSDLIQASLPSESFSGIILWDVIEHLNNINLILAEVFRLLKPGGVVFIGTVHRHGFSMRLLGGNALTVNPPEHLTFFTRKGMNKVLQNAGFKVARQWSFSIYLREWIHFFSRFKIKKTQKNKTYKSETNYSYSLTKSKLFVVIMKIANAILRSANLGDEIVVLAQKEIK